MAKKFCLILISIVLIFFFITPLFAFAEDISWPLKEKEVQDLLDIIRKEPLTDANEDLFFESLRYVFSDYPRKTGAVVLTKQAILKKQLDYWLKGIPLEISKTFLKTALKLVPLIYGAPDIGTVINLIEKFTVQEATKYATNWLLQNEIKIGTGKGDYSFLSYKNNWEKIDIPYIIAYHPLGPTYGKIVAEFYSKNPIEAPMGTGPNALASNQDNPNTNCWPWDRWIENERKRDNDGKLEPFIVRVKGSVRKDQYGRFNWETAKGEPVVEVEFDKAVPQIAQSDIIWQSETIREFYFITEKLVKPAMDKLQSVGEKIKAAPQTLKTKFVELKAKAVDLVKKIQSYFGKIEPEAQIGEVSAPALSAERAGAELAKLTEEAVGLGKPLEKPKVEELPKPPKLNFGGLEEMAERFDEISERIEILLANAQTFLAEKEKKEVEQTHNKIGQVSDFVMEEETTAKTEEIAQTKEIAQEETSEEKKIALAPETPEPLRQEVIFCALSGNQVPVRNRIVFNEIVWMGSQSSSNDEWIELKNISGSAISIAGWQILDKDQQIKIALQGTTLSTAGFFLLERSSDNSVPGVLADLIYTGALNNTEEALYLFDGNCTLQDKAEANPYWQAGSNASKKTMERKTDLTWQTSRETGGTPKAENSAGEIYYTGGGGGGSSEELSTEPTTCSQENLPSPTLSLVIFNEIAWMGGISWQNEWVELKNISENSVSLNGWQILDKDEQIKIFFDSSNLIVANGFYLLEREEGAVPDIPADKIYSGYLNNDNESLRLFDENCNLIDEVLASPNWPGGDNLEKKSMERSSDLSSWYTFSGEGENGILGTPKKENSQPISEDTEAPIVRAGPDQTVEINQPVSFDGSGSTDNVGIVSYKWDVDADDGLNWENPDLSGQNPSFESGYSATGTYVVTLKVSDEAGNNATDTLTVTVNPPPEILISEVQITGQTVNEEFVELYNPNSSAIDLAGFSLKKKTSGGTESNLVSAAKFSGTIPSLGYFLITPQNYSSKDYYIAANNTVLFYSQYGNLIDDVANIDHPKNYSWGRKWSTATLTYQDFELQIPTPGAQNEKDLTPPETEITFWPPVLTNQTTAIFRFSANEDGSSFQCQLDSKDWDNCSSLITYSGLSDGSHIFYVKSTDLAGNEDQTPAQHPWTIDTTIKSPTLSLFDLDSTSSLYTNNQTVKVEVTQDEEAVAWFLSENSEKPATNTVGWLNIKPATSTLSASEGTKRVYIWTKDAADNVSQLGNSASITLDTIPPQVEITEAPPNPTNQAATTFAFSCNEDNCFFEYKLDDNPWQKPNKTGRSSDFVRFENLAEGEHFFQVRAADQAGNYSATSSDPSAPCNYTWLLDLTPPSSQVEGLTTSSTSTTLTIKWSGTDNASGILNYDVQYRDGSEGEWQNLVEATTTLQTKFSGENEHTYYFQSRAKDQAENEEPWPETPDTFCKIDLPNQAPTPYFSYSPKENIIVGDEITFDAAYSTDTDGYVISYAWNFGDSNSTTTEQITTTHSYAISGDYTVLLTILDNDGATSSTSTTIYIMPKPPLFLTVTFPSQNQVFTSSSPDTNNTLSGFQTIAEGTTTAQALVSISRATTTITTTTASTAGKWELEITLEQGENIFVFKTEDKFGQSATTSLTLILDTIPPIKITDLSATGSDIDAIKLSWTSPQDAIQYDIRFSTSTAIDENNWDSTYQISDEPSPAEPASLQTFTITGLSSNTIYYFAIKSEDENGNISEISNSPWGKTLNQPPVSAFSYLPEENIMVGDEITFDASNSYDPEDNPLNYLWDFDDGCSTTTASEIITHSFATVGEFLVSLVVEDSEGATSSPVTALIETAEKPKPKILISEVQTESAANKKDEFIELYNPNDEEVDISQWSIQKSYSTSSTVYKKNFEKGNVMPAEGYFLIVNSNATSSLLDLAAQDGMAHNSFTLAENNTVYLVSNQEEIQTATDTDIVDKVGFGENVFSEGEPAQNPLSDPPPDKSIGRKWSTTTQTYQDTDNNQEDFELQSPTPKDTNQTLPQNQVPSALFTYSPENPQVDQEVLFNAASSTDPDGTIISYAWDFGDGNSTTTNSATTSHTFGTLGQFQITLFVVDNQAATSTPATATIEVAAPLPPESVQNFVASPTNNTVTLTWTAAIDPDSPEEDISYVIFYAKQGQSEATTSATTTTVTLTDLYYDSTYNFGIKAFDGLNFSKLTTTSLQIAAETPQWQGLGYNSQRTFRSSSSGPTASTTKWHYDAAEAGVSQFWTGPAIDQNGTIYLGTTGLLALKEEAGQPKKKWFYSHSSGVYQPPLIGPDGTVYIIVPNKILAISPAGTLKWELSEIDTSFSNGSTNYHEVNLAIANNVLYYAAPQQVGGITKPSLVAIDPASGTISWSYYLTDENSFNPPSSPAIAPDGTILISFDKALFAIDSQGNLKWKKVFTLHQNCTNNYLNPIPNVSLDNDGTIYFVLKGSYYVQACGYYAGYCADSLYAVNPGAMDPATSTLTAEEMKWKQDLGSATSHILLGGTNIYLRTALGCNQDYYLCSFDKQGVPGLPVLTPSNFQVVDSIENLYGSYGTFPEEVIGLSSQGTEMWRYNPPGTSYFLFSFALSNNGVLYAPTSYTLYAFGQE